MAVNKNNRVKMIGPKGKISYVSLKASRSVHLSNLGFMIAHDQGPTVEEFAPHEPPTDEDQRRTGPLGFKSSSHAGKA